MTEHDRDALHLVRPAPAPDDVDREIAVALRAGVPPVDLVRGVGQKIARARGPRRVLVGAGLVALFGAGTAVGLVATRATSTSAAAHAGSPVVILMDATAPHAVYDKETAARGGTNADDLNDLLRDLPVQLTKETISSTWDREVPIALLHPDLVVVHRSAFFHSMNLEIGLGYPPFADAAAEARWRHLYKIADDKLVAVLGLLAASDDRTRFLVYSRGTGGGWPDAEYRKHWVLDAERRFPALKGKLTTMMVAGGVDAGSFKNEDAAGQMKDAVRAILHVPD